jgi:hypothetical protein
MDVKGRILYLDWATPVDGRGQAGRARLHRSAMAEQHACRERAVCVIRLLQAADAKKRGRA